MQTVRGSNQRRTSNLHTYLTLPSPPPNVSCRRRQVLKAFIVIVAVLGNALKLLLAVSTAFSWIAVVVGRRGHSYRAIFQIP